MTSDEVYDLIVRIRESASVNDKVRLLREHENDTMLKTVLEYAYNPRKTYNQYELGFLEYGTHGLIGLGPDTWSILDRMYQVRNGRKDMASLLSRYLKLLTPKSKELLICIMRKNLRAGISEGLINRVFTGLIPTYPYMRCCLGSRKVLESYLAKSGAVWVQVKMDGLFCTVVRSGDLGIELITRQGTAIPLDGFESFGQLASRLKSDTHTHGEFIVYKDGKRLHRKDSNGVFNRIINGGEFLEDEYPIFYAWDQISLHDAAVGQSDIPYKTRYGLLQKQLESPALLDGAQLQLLDTYIASTVDDVMKYTNQLIRNREEGTVAKNPDGPWVDGTGKDQAKLKPYFDVDLVIEKVLMGTIGTANENKPGSLTCASLDGKLKVDVPVKNAAMRKALIENPGEWIGRIMKVRGDSIITAPDLTCSLYLPRFVDASYRIDKTTADTLAQIFEQYNAVHEGGFTLPDH